MAQIQMVGSTSQSTPVPLGFCRVIADVVRRILKDQENDTSRTAGSIKMAERAGTGE